MCVLELNSRTGVLLGIWSKISGSLVCLRITDSLSHTTYVETNNHLEHGSFKQYLHSLCLISRIQISVELQELLFYVCSGCFQLIEILEYKFQAFSLCILSKKSFCLIE